jgi:predicted amidohydrolase
MKIALVQFPVANRLSLSQFSQKVRQYLTEARQSGAGLVMFPELFLLDCIDRVDVGTDAQALARLADEMPKFLAEPGNWAKEYGVHLIFGSLPWRTPSGKIRNRSYVFSKTGEIHYQDKLFLTPDEKFWGWEGGTELRPFQLDGLRLQILICYDIQFASLSQLIAPLSIEGIFCPSLTDEFGRERVAIGCQARAIENFLQVFVTGATGGKAGLYRSRAALYGPRNEQFSGPQEEPNSPIAYFSWDVEHLRKAKSQAGIYSGRDALAQALPIRVGDFVSLGPNDHLGHEIKV